MCVSAVQSTASSLTPCIVDSQRLAARLSQHTDAVQILIFQGNAVRLICFVLLLLFIVLEATHHAANGNKRLVLVASAVIGGLVSVALLVLACLLLHTLVQLHKQKKQW